MIELLIVLGIIGLLIIVSTPKINQILAEGRAPKVSEALQSAMTKSTLNRHAGGDWASASNSELANILEGNTTVYVTTGTPPKIEHDLNTDERGEITLAPGSIAASNDSGQLTVSKLNAGTCPIVSNSLQKLAHVITINGTTIKDASTKYSGGMAQETCRPGNSNTLVVMFR